MMRAALSLLAVALLPGCAQLSQLLPSRVTEVLVPADDRPTMQVTIAALNARGLVTEAARNGQIVTWSTQDNRTISFLEGIVVATRGLGDDLMGADVAQTRDAFRGGAGDWGPRIHGYMNGEYQSYFMAFQCRRTGSQFDTVQINGSARNTTRIDETCVNDEIQIENTYWRNGNGVMLKSRQWVSKGVGYMETERVLR